MAEARAAKTGEPVEVAYSAILDSDEGRNWFSISKRAQDEEIAEASGRKTTEVYDANHVRKRVDARQGGACRELERYVRETAQARGMDESEAYAQLTASDEKARRLFAECLASDPS